MDMIQGNIGQTLKEIIIYLKETEHTLGQCLPT